MGSGSLKNEMLANNVHRSNIIIAKTQKIFLERVFKIQNQIKIIIALLKYSTKIMYSVKLNDGENTFVHTIKKRS